MSSSQHDLGLQPTFGNHGRGRHQQGHPYHQRRVNDGQNSVSLVPRPPPSSSGMATLLSWANNPTAMRHTSSSSRSHVHPLGVTPTATRVDRLVVHPTAPPLPYSHSPFQEQHRRGEDSASTQRVTSRFWTNPGSLAQGPGSGNTMPSPSCYPPISPIPSFFSSRRPTSGAAAPLAPAPYRSRQRSDEVGAAALPTPSQTPHMSSIGSPTLDCYFLPDSQLPSAALPFSSRGSASFSVHQPLQANQPSQLFSFPVPSRRPPSSPNPHGAHVHPPVPLPTQVDTSDDQTLAELERQLVSYETAPSPPPKLDLIADFRARLQRPLAAPQNRNDQPRPSGFAWNQLQEQHSPVAAAHSTLKHQNVQQGEQMFEEDMPSVGSNVYAALAGTAPVPMPLQIPPVPGGAYGEPHPPASGAGVQQVTGMVPATQLVMSNGGRLPVKPVSDLPARFRGLFTFPCFNYIQTQCYDHLMHSDANIVTSSPTGSGKTALLDLALIRLWTTHPSSRAVYLAPTKALCAERAADWTRRLQPLGITVAELTGDTSLFDARGAHNAQLLVITSEKYDAVTRRWRESSRMRQFVAHVGLVLLDEVHLLASSRGATLEALVARMKVVAAELKTHIRYVALSATFPNIQDVGTWLGGDAKVFTFGEEYRPVRLERQVLGFSSTHRSPWQFEKLLDARLPDVIREHAAGKPALVFCATRKAAEATAKTLVVGGEGPMPGAMGHPFVRTSQHARALAEAAHRVRNHAAREVLVHGVAFHHAGVEMADRQLIEQLFLAGQLLVLCTTSTLAVGVNLPAYLVVLKGTQTWVGGQMQEYAPMDVLQMLGRAGRPQFETSGKAVIMTTANKVEEYESLVSGCTVVESSLHLNLVEHLNAEIAQGTITNEQLAVQWLESTFLYVRLRVAPAYYANVVRGTDNLRELVGATLQVLQTAEMVREPLLTAEVAAAVGTRLECTEYGKLMSRYCLSLQTMQALMAGGPSIPQQLYSMALAGEFSGTYVKAGDKTMLADLNKMQGIKFRLPDKYKFKSTADKVYLVVQAVLGGVQLQGKDMDRLRVFVSCEQGNIWSALSRIAAAAVELNVARRDTVPYAADRIRYSILLLQSVRTKIWFDSTRVLRQVDKLGPVLTSTLAEAGITTFGDLASAQPWRLEQLCRRNPPFGSGLVAAANQVPHLDVLGRLVQSTMILSVTVSNSTTCKKGPHGGTSWVHIVIHDELGALLFHDRVALLNLARSEFKATINLPPSAHCVFASLLAENYVGLDVHLQADPRTRQVSLMPRWLLPESAFAPPDTSAEFASAASQLPGPPFPPALAAGPHLPHQPPQKQRHGPSVPPPPLNGPPAQQTPHGPGSAPPFMMPYQPLAPPAPSQPATDATQLQCKHKCKDRYKCKHACCKRGLGERPPSPIRPSRPPAASQKKQLTLEQVIQAIPQPVVVLSDSDSDSDDDSELERLLDCVDASLPAGPTRRPTPKLTPPPPADSLDDDWGDLDDSVFVQAASLDVPRSTPPRNIVTQASHPLFRTPFAATDAQNVALHQQQLTPPHTDTPSGDRIPDETLPSSYPFRGPPTLFSSSQRSNRLPAESSNLHAGAAVSTLTTHPGVSSAGTLAGNDGSKQNFRFRADLIPRSV